MRQSEIIKPVLLGSITTDAGNKKYLEGLFWLADHYSRECYYADMYRTEENKHKRQAHLDNAESIRAIVALGYCQATMPDTVLWLADQYVEASRRERDATEEVDTNE